MSKASSGANSRKQCVLKLSVVDSTNTFAKLHFEDLRDGTAIVADVQSAGRGRAGRSWLSPEGNLFLTLVLKPDILHSPTSAHSCMTHYLGVCLCLLLEKLGLKPSLKWPNDIHLEGKKIAGILAESIPMPKGKMGIVLGIGVNLDVPTSLLETIDQPAISLAQVLPPAKRLTRDRFLKLFLNLFFEEYELFLKSGFPLIAETYDSFLLYKGERVRLQTSQKTLWGILKGAGPDGSLLLVDSQNQLLEYYAGDLWLDTLPGDDTNEG